MEDPQTPITVYAVTLHEMYTAFKNAGFNEAEALVLVSAQMSIIAQQGGNS